MLCFQPQDFFFKLKLVEINTYTCVLHVRHYKCILMSNNVFKLHIKMSWSVCVRQSLASRYHHGMVSWFIYWDYLSCQKVLPKKHEEKKDKDWKLG